MSLDEGWSPPAAATNAAHTLTGFDSLWPGFPSSSSSCSSSSSIVVLVDPSQRPSQRHACNRRVLDYGGKSRRAVAATPLLPATSSSDPPEAIHHRPLIQPSTSPGYQGTTAQSPETAQSLFPQLTKPRGDIFLSRSKYFFLNWRAGRSWTRLDGFRTTLCPPNDSASASDSSSRHCQAGQTRSRQGATQRPRRLDERHVGRPEPPHPTPKLYVKEPPAPQRAR